ncbi:MAG: hypothetical protein FWD60_04625 [Candidatus Azobacteroides sp.]|nr:hypothetical protein [Candidatus Azobacteroides sp.]
MTLNELLSKFLPDFRIRIMDAKAQSPQWTAEQETKWVANVFHEAIQNFADRICEKQRIKCAVDARSEICEYTEQPKIEDI